MPKVDLTPLANVVLRWRGDPVAYVREMFGVEPTSQQAQMLNGASKPGAHAAVKSGHGTGKSTSFAWLALWGLTCFSDVKIGCTAPTAHQLQDVLWPEIRKWRDRMLEPWRSAVDVTSDKVTVRDTDNFAVARTARKDNPDAMQGLHATVMIFLIDEASGIDDVVFEVAQGALSTPGARVVMAGNPTRTTGYFHRAFHVNRAYWDCYTFTCIDSPLVSSDYVKQMRDEYGEDSDIYRVRVAGEFPSGGDMQFIRLTDVERAATRIVRDDAFDFAPVLLGVDVAWYGGDESVIFKRQGLWSQIVWHAHNVDPTTLSGIVAQLEDEHQADAVFVDATGIGAGVLSNLISLGRMPIRVDFGGGAAKKEYLNKRAECWGEMRKWIVDEGKLPDHQRLKDDLTGVEYQYNMTGKLQLERKEVMRKRGLASPDYADALALTFAAPVRPKGDKFRRIDNRLNPSDRYDPFEFRGGGVI